MGVKIIFRKVLATLSVLVLFLASLWLNAGGIGFAYVFVFIFLCLTFLLFVSGIQLAKNFKLNSLYIIYLLASLSIGILLIFSAYKLFVGWESTTIRFNEGRKIIWLLWALIITVVIPLGITELEHSRSRKYLRFFQPQIYALLLFIAYFPTQHFISINFHVFSPQLAAQFFLVALALPVAAYIFLHAHLKKLVSDQAFFFANSLVATAILLLYTRPLFRYWNLKLSLFIDQNLPSTLLMGIVAILLVYIANRFRQHLITFLSMFAVLLTINGLITVISHKPVWLESSKKLIDENIEFEYRPNIYILILDGYQNLSGLTAKGLARDYIGPDLEAINFEVHENAFSNYKPSQFSILSFLNLQHNFYQLSNTPGKVLTGDNQLYSILKANNYKTLIVHPSNHFVRGECQSDFCYPNDGKLGNLRLVLGQTLFYQNRFFQSHKRDYEEVWERETLKAGEPFVIYSHILSPSHSPDGCFDEKAEIESYAHRLRSTNERILRKVEQIQRSDSDALIILAGDHGAFISSNCSWDFPDVSSQESIIDNLGILLAVKWPQGLTRASKRDIHSLMDLSWSVLQGLSNHQYPNDLRPESASYLKTGPTVYKVIEKGKLLGSPVPLNEKSDH